MEQNLVFAVQANLEQASMMQRDMMTMKKEIGAAVESMNEASGRIGRWSFSVVLNVAVITTGAFIIGLAVGRMS